MSETERELVLPADPIQAFETWYQDAVNANLFEPTAMTLATVSKEGLPSARVVLFKGLRDRCFSFVTNYESRKAKELGQNPFVSLVFHWAVLERQVRIEGKVERWSEAESDAYFASRPRGSQIGAWSSPQSQPISSRDELLVHVQEVEARFKGRDVPRPPNWGGYNVRPTRIEFWEGRPSRLHERFVFVQQDGQWHCRRLAP